MAITYYEYVGVATSTIAIGEGAYLDEGLTQYVFMTDANTINKGVDPNNQVYFDAIGTPVVGVTYYMEYGGTMVVTGQGGESGTDSNLIPVSGVNSNEITGIGNFLYGNDFLEFHTCAYTVDLGTFTPVLSGYSFDPVSVTFTDYAGVFSGFTATEAPPAPGKAQNPTPADDAENIIIKGIDRLKKLEWDAPD